MKLELETVKLLLEKNKPNSVRMEFEKITGFEGEIGFLYNFSFTFGNSGYYKESVLNYTTEDKLEAGKLLSYMVEVDAIGGDT